MTSEPSAPAGPRPVPDLGPPQTRRQRREQEAARARKAKAGSHFRDLHAKVKESDEEVASRSAGAQYAGDPDPYKKKDEPDPDLDD